MKACFFAVAVALSLVSSAARASSFDSSDGQVHFDANTLATYGFEQGEELPAGTTFAKWSSNSFALTKTSIDTASVDAALSNDGTALEGERAFLVQNATGLLIDDEALFAKVKSARVEISLWAKSIGNSASFSIGYGKTQDEIYGAGLPFVQVRALRTGRETSDGWVEYSSGPIDGSVWGVPLASIMVLPSRSSSTSGSVWVDAIEVKSLTGAITEPKACTMATMDKVCGDGDCMFGHCVTSTATWGALPPIAHRRELAERWIKIATEIQGDRAAAVIGSTTFATGARELAESSTSSRQFFGGMNRLVNLLRNNHTSFGGPVNFTNFSPQVSFGSSSSLRACFGVVEKDIAGGGQALAVFEAGATPLSGVLLRAGDILTSIDGRDPKAWIDDVYPYVATTLPNDPLSDLGNVSVNVSTLISIRASNLVVSRCKSATQCDAGNRTDLPIDIATPIYGVLNGTVTQPEGQRFGCSARFTDSVSKLNASNGEDAVSSETGPSGEVFVQFDGFEGQTAWEGSMTSIFSPKPAKVIMDARMGHGGYYSAVEALFNLLRGTGEPFGVLSVGRGSHEDPDPSWLLATSSSCLTSKSSFDWSCYSINTNGFLATVATPPGANTKIAWLNSIDVSANDFMPRLLKGRSKFRIFAPHPTSGAFGAIVSVPGMSGGFQGGSIQIQDSRFGATASDVIAASWESGHGVVPDQVVAQKLSDTLSGVDTILTAAKAWVNTP